MRAIDLSAQLMEIRSLLGDVQGTMRDRGARLARVEEALGEVAERVAAIEERQRSNIAELDRLRRAIDRLRRGGGSDDDSSEIPMRTQRLSTRTRAGIITGIGGALVGLWEWVLPWLQAWFSHKPRGTP